MGTINIGGVQITGNDIRIENGVVTVDGVVISGVNNTAGDSIVRGGTLLVRIVEGRVENLRADGSLHCATNVEGSVNAGGSVSVSGDVKGNANAGGSVTCGDVGGNASAGGSVKCGDVRGNVTAMTVKRG